MMNSSSMDIIFYLKQLFIIFFFDKCNHLQIEGSSQH